MDGAHRDGRAAARRARRGAARRSSRCCAARMRAMARELERGRARALEAERLRAFRETARQVAHELKNPLTPIRFAVARLAARRRRRWPSRWRCWRWRPSGWRRWRAASRSSAGCPRARRRRGRRGAGALRGAVDRAGERAVPWRWTTRCPRARLPRRARARARQRAAQRRGGVPRRRRRSRVQRARCGACTERPGVEVAVHDSGMRHRARRSWRASGTRT